MTLEEREGVEPVIEQVCRECGGTLTRQEIQAALDVGGPYLCTVHAQEQLDLDEAEEGQPS
jgi:hypothetical protein